MYIYYSKNYYEYYVNNMNNTILIIITIVGDYLVRNV